jgi:hypothetical protein
MDVPLSAPPSPHSADQLRFPAPARGFPVPAARWSLVRLWRCLPPNAGPCRQFSPWSLPAMGCARGCCRQGTPLGPWSSSSPRDWLRWIGSDRWRQPPVARWPGGSGWTSTPPPPRSWRGFRGSALEWRVESWRIANPRVPSGPWPTWIGFPGWGPPCSGKWRPGWSRGGQRGSGAGGQEEWTWLVPRSLVERRISRTPDHPPPAPLPPCPPSWT